MYEQTKVTIVRLLYVTAVFFMMALTAKGQTSIVAFSLAANNVATGGITGNTGICTLSENVSGDPSFSSNDGAGVSGWDQGFVGGYYWSTSFTTTGYYNISLSETIRSESGGPADFVIEWSTNGTDFTAATATSGFGNPYVAGTNATSPLAYLPAGCNNQAVVDIRWRKNSDLAVNGGAISSIAKTFIKNINVFGLKQAFNITFQSNSNNLIYVTWNNAAANTKNVVTINSSNSFTTPADGTNPSASTSYTYGSGEQVVYNDQGTTVTVTVSDPSQSYWVEVYSYSRFFSNPEARIFVPAAGANYPVMASFPVITSPAISNILTTGSGAGGSSADIGGTITANRGYAITEKGIYFSSNSPVTASSNKNPDTGGSEPWIGAFSSRQTFYPKSRYFFRAFASSGYGTVLTATEVTFYTPAYRPSRHSTGFALAAATRNSLTLAWEGLKLAGVATDGYLILMRPCNAAPTGLPVDGHQYVAGNTLGDGTVAAIITDTNAAVVSAVIGSLASYTPYSFTLIPYGGNTSYSETFVYRTDATIQAVTATTLAYAWTGADGADWAVSSNWDPVRTSPATDDVLVFGNAGSKTITGVPTQTIAGLVVGGTASVTLRPSSAQQILTISGELTVNAGSHLVLVPRMAITVNGTLTNNSGSAQGLTIESDDSGIYGNSSGSLIYNGTASGDITYKRFMTGASSI